MPLTMRAEQLRLHRANRTKVVFSSAMATCILAALLWDGSPRALVALWVAGIALALTVRMAVSRAHDRDTAAGRNPDRWIRWYRACYAVHGLAWSLLGLVLWRSEGAQFHLLVLVLVALAASAFYTTVFDVPAATEFVVPVVATLMINLALNTVDGSVGTAVATMVFMVITFSSALGAQRIVQQAVELRLAESQSAAETRRHAEQVEIARRELADKGSLLTLLLKGTQQGFTLVDASGTVIDVNPALCAMLGCESTELVGHRLIDRFDPVSAAVLKQGFASSNMGTPGEFEIGFVCADGRRLHCQVNCTPIRWALDVRLDTVAIWTDISARRQTELALGTYEAAINSITDMVSVLNEDQTYRTVNDAWCQTIGLQRVDVIGSHPSKVLSPASSVPRRNAMRECIEQQEIKVVRGTFNWPTMAGRIYESKYYPYVQAGTQEKCVVIVTRDVTNEEQALQEIQDLEAEQRALLEAFPGYITRMDETYTYTYINRRLAERMGNTADRLTGLSIEDVLGPQRATWLRPHLKRAFAGELVTYERSDDLDDGSGQIDQVTLALGEDHRTGRPVIYSFGIDISRQKRVEHDLLVMSNSLAQKSDELETVLDSIDQGIIAIGPDGTLGVHNRRALQLLELGDTNDSPGPNTAFDGVIRDGLVQDDRSHDRTILDAFMSQHQEDGDQAEPVYVRKSTSGNAIEIRNRRLQNGGLVRTYADVSMYFKTLQSVLDANMERRTLLDAYPGFIAAFDQSMTYTFVNERYANLFGRHPRNVVGRSVRAIVGDALAERTEAEVRHAQPARPLVAQWRLAATRHYPAVDLEVTHVCGPRRSDGSVYFYTFAMDVTKRNRVEAELRIAAAAFESQDGMMVTDEHLVIQKVNQAFTEMTGYTESEAIGKTPRNYQSDQQNADFYTAMWDSIHRTGGWQGEILDRRKNGEIYPKHLNISAVRDAKGRVTHYVTAHRDTTQHKRAAEQIEQLAFFDSLTRLPNRTLLRDRLRAAMGKSARNGCHCAAVLLDLDHFKHLNDTLGHEHGDLLLQRLAQRLTEGLREHQTIARVGGDEFLLLTESLDERRDWALARVKELAAELQASLSEGFQLGDARRRITVSMGVTLFRGQESSIDEVLMQAELAMYRTKDTGRNAVTLFEPSMQSQMQQRAALESELGLGLQRGELLLHYQPQVNSDGRVVGAEALVRWQHPKRGMVSPGEFIPVAESSGLILPLGHWVMETACEQLARWATDPILSEFVVAVNVSAIQFQKDNFVDSVVGLLQKTGARADRLKLELTESLLVANVEDVIQKMSALKAIGLGFSLDDFGTGYSSLAYLSRLPLDQLKIDRSFVNNIEFSDNAVAICAATIGLAHSLKLKVVAEGVETEAQRYFLSTVHRCDYVQGYLYSRPVPLAEFEAFANARALGGTRSTG